MNAKEREMFDECEGMYNDFGMSYTEDEIKAQLPKVDLPIKRFGVKYQDKIEELKLKPKDYDGFFNNPTLIHEGTKRYHDIVYDDITEFNNSKPGDIIKFRKAKKLSMFGRLIDFIVRRFR